MSESAPVSTTSAYLIRALKRSVATLCLVWGTSLSQVCFVTLLAYARRTQLTSACLVGVLLSLNIRLDYLKNVDPFSTGSYFVYTCIGPQLVRLSLLS